MGRMPYREQRAYGRIFGFDERCEEAIRRTMERENLTRAQIAERIGCRVGRIQTSHLIEAGGISYSVVLARFCAVTKTSADWLLGLPERRRNEEG